MKETDMEGFLSFRNSFRTSLGWAVFLLAASVSAHAQEPQPEIDPEEADISITATVRIQELRFEVVGDPKVELFGHPERLTEDRAERTNLPEPAQPGVTYRDVGIRLKIASVFADIDRIVAEALGEVPPAEIPEVEPPLAPSDPPEGRPQ